MITIRNVFIPDGWVGLSDWGPRFNTTVITQLGGYVDTQENWPFALWAGTIQYHRAIDDPIENNRLDAAYRFFLNSRGMGRGFLLLDYGDNQATDKGGNGTVEVVDGVLRLVKNYYDGLDTYQRLITQPGDDVVLAGGALGGTVGALGVVTDASAGTWTGTFAVPMRLTSDNMPQQIVANDGTVTLDLGVAEVREA